MPAPQQSIDESDEVKLQEMIERFQKADLDGNGRLDKEELLILLRSQKPGDHVLSQLWLPEADELSDIMKMYDKDNSGTIEFEEFKQLVYDGILIDGKLHEYHSAFSAVDTSGNGSIGASELAQMLTACGQSISYEKLVTIMQKFDKDESGQIEFPEFLLMFREELLDLKEVLNYVSMLPDKGEAGTGMFEALNGELTPIFNEKELDEAVAQSHTRVVVVFAALTWCRSCKGMQRPMQKLANHYQSQAIFIKLFGNSNSQTKLLFKDRLAVRSTPSFIMFKNGQIVINQAGGTRDKVEAALRSVLDPAGLPDVLYPLEAQVQQ